MEEHRSKNLRAYFVLATDLDDTLLGDPEALAQLNDWLGHNRKKALLIYLTGRHLDSALRAIEEEKLLWPDILVTDVGARIGYSPSYEPDPAWEEQVLRGWEPRRIAAVLNSWPQLLPQPVPAERRLSYFIPREVEAEQVAEAVRNLTYPQF